MLRMALRTVIIVGILIGTLAFSSNAHAQIEPPNDGNWTIDESITIRDKSIVLNGDLIVQSGGELNLSGI